jgi:threonine dehydrogenase-like Zn-dependent dehydrogenase
MWYMPKHVPLESAALVGGLAVSMQAATFLDPEPGDTVLVVGAGPIGWGVIQHSKLRGANVVAVDVKPDRLEQARKFKADVVLDANSDGLQEAIREACGGPPLFVAECSGVTEGSKTAFEAAGRGARIATVGVTANPISQHYLILKGLTVAGIGGGIKQQRCIDLLAAGKLDLGPCITHHYPFSQLKEAFERKRTDPEAVRIAIDVTA